MEDKLVTVNDDDFIQGIACAVAAGVSPLHSVRLFNTDGGGVSLGIHAYHKAGKTLLIDKIFKNNQGALSKLGYLLDRYEEQEASRQNQWIGERPEGWEYDTSSGEFER
jgi:hypothetical protein